TPTQFPPQTTLREIVHTSMGGSFVRVRLSNEIGTQPLVIGGGHVALSSADGSIVSESDRTPTFSGQSSITIPPGAPSLSDAGHQPAVAQCAGRAVARRARFRAPGRAERRHQRQPSLERRKFRAQCVEAI